MKCSANAQYELKPLPLTFDFEEPGGFRCAASCIVFYHFTTNIPVLCTIIYLLYGGQIKPQSGAIFVVW